ncbi:MAG TPA: imidazole glycerol phosphate synthase subunit HisH, partial [Dehalococcoidia bacterium]|nr:imidazole glycerol phosphate synthase subunit HisH [Dehalococcoidia bacterium]
AHDTTRALKERGLDEPFRQVVAEGRPVLGVCVGLQVLFDWTEEGGGAPCLGVLPGLVRRLPAGQKVPHMGWNQVAFERSHPILDGIPDNTNFYFVHSYHVVPADPAITLGTTEYGVRFPSLIATGSLVATQFHPEKSGAWGLRFYRNFCRLALGVPAR